MDFSNVNSLLNPWFPVVLITLFVNLQGTAQCNFKPIGHRGGSSYYYPENTLVSLEQGFMENIYAAEVDVRSTADNVLVLMHDSYVNRTTNGSGNIEDLTLDYVKSLDAGSWKDSRFAGTKVPTLEQALLLTRQFDKKLYLNMKIFAPELIAKTLKNAGVNEDIILLDPDDIEKVKAYHEILPNTPLVYFGAFPGEDELPGFFAELKENGVVAIEIPADYIYKQNGDEYHEMKDLAHQNGMEFWAYTVNDATYFQFLKDFGIDALETDRPSAACQFFCEEGSGGFFPEKRITGQWDFNFNLEGTIGSQLVYIGDSTVENQKIKFGTTESFGIPLIENTNVNVARIPAFDKNHALRFFSNIAPEGLPGGLDCDNTYTLVFDLLMPNGNDSYTALLQTSNNNSDDADFFLMGASNSFGILEDYNGSFADSSWVRLVLVFDLYNEKLDEYLNGNYVGTVILEDSKNGRFCLNNNWGVQASHFFSDNDNETNPVFVSSIQLRNYVMSALEIGELGGVEARKINSSIFIDPEKECPEFEGEIIMEKVGSTIVLLANAGDMVNYRWEINREGVWENITGTDFRNPAFPELTILNPVETMNGYQFRCIAFNNCESYSNEFTLDDIQTGVYYQEEVSGFLIYPNPTRGKINIAMKNKQESYTIQIFTSQGAQVFQDTIVTGNLQLHLPPGSYFVKVMNNRFSETRKLIVSR